MVCTVLTLHPTPSLSHEHPSYKELLSTAETLMDVAKPGADNSHSLAELQAEWPHLFSPTLFQQELWKGVTSLLARNVSFF